MGVSGAVQSLMGVMAPTIAGILYQVNTIYMLICYECTLIFFSNFLGSWNNVSLFCIR